MVANCQKTPLPPLLFSAIQYTEQIIQPSDFTVVQAVQETSGRDANAAHDSHGRNAPA